VNPAAQADRETRILQLWEGAVGRSRRDRDEALLADSSRPRALGERNRALIAIRTALFGRDWPLRSECPVCGSGCEFVIDGGALAGELDLMAVPGRGGVVELQGREVVLRALTADDLYAVAGQDDVAGAIRALAARCLPADVGAGELTGEELDLLGRRIEALDPAAMISFALDCPDCGHRWTAPIDLAEALWMEVQRSAERLLTDIDALAKAYGWSEDAVVSLSPVRRAAYLQLVAAI
jgi:hypothetical protein